MTEQKPNRPDGADVVPMNEFVNSDASGDAAAVNPAAPTDPLTAARAERDAFKDRWLRSEAELDNFRKRSAREAEQERLYQSAGLTRDLLPAFDNLLRAVDAAKATANPEDVLQGISMVLQQIDDALKRHSIRLIESTGQPFDPNLHSAIQMAPSTDVPANMVLQEVQRGYKLHDRVIRPSMVIVSSGPPQG